MGFSELSKQTLDETLQKSKRMNKDNIPGVSSSYQFYEKEGDFLHTAEEGDIV